MKKAKPTVYIYTDLVLDTGELVRVRVPSEHVDDFYESIDHTMKRGDWWSPGQFDGCQADFMGIYLDRVCMRRVVGMT